MSSDTSPPRPAGRRHAKSGPTGTPGRVRWRRFAILFVPAAGVTAVLLGLTASGALASSFSISGNEFEVSADQLTGTGFQQFGTIDQTAGGTNAQTGQPNPEYIAVAESEIGSADITNLCQSVVANFPLGLGTYTLRITAGNGGTPVHADSLIIDANQLSGSTATFQNINIGQDASTLNAVSGVPDGVAGSFGQQASGVSITGLRQTAYSTSAGTFTLPGFSLSLSAGSNACF
jgi:Family of unknown function (DUF6230)